MRKATVAALVLVSILLSMTAVSANNVWNGWHWKSDSRSPTVADQTTDSIYDVAGEVGELAGLATGITPTNTQSNKGDIEVKEQFSIQWFGLALLCSTSRTRRSTSRSRSSRRGWVSRSSSGPGEGSC